MAGELSAVTSCSAALTTVNKTLATTGNLQPHHFACEMRNKLKDEVCMSARLENGTT
jgi:hypothetical protein